MNPLITKIQESARLFDEKFIYKQVEYQPHGFHILLDIEDRNPASSIQMKDFHRSSLISLFQANIERLEGVIVNRPEKVAELNKDLPNKLQEESYLKAVGYCEAIDQEIAFMRETIKSLEYDNIS